MEVKQNDKQWRIKMKKILMLSLALLTVASTQARSICVWKKPFPTRPTASQCKRICRKKSKSFNGAKESKTERVRGSRRGTTTYACCCR